MLDKRVLALQTRDAEKDLGRWLRDLADR